MSDLFLQIFLVISIAGVLQQELEWQLFTLKVNDVFGNENTDHKVSVEKHNDKILVKNVAITRLPFVPVSSNTVIYNGTDAATGIQTGLNSLSSGDTMRIYNGTYYISEPLDLRSHTYILGQGNSTILDYSDLERGKDAIRMASGSSLSGFKISGSIVPLPEDFSQRVRANHDVNIENLTISHMGYGIDTIGSSNVTLTNIKCESIQSTSDWAACIHAKDTRDLSISRFDISYSNRGIELDANTTNVLVQNGSMFNIRNFNNTGHEAFSLDVHAHDHEGASNNITFQDVYVKDSYAPSTKISSDDQYNLSDLPRSVTYRNVTVINPTSVWQVNGDNVTIRDSRIINSSGDIMVLYKNSKNIRIENLTCTSLPGNKYFIFNTPKHTGIHNVSIVQSTIYDQPGKRGPTMSFHEVDGISLSDNKIINAPRDSEAISTRGVSNFVARNNTITYATNPQLT